MPKFKYDPALGSFKAWLRQLTQWRIKDQLRKKQYARGDERRLKEVPLGTTLMETHPDTAADQLEQVWDDEWKANLVYNALEHIKTKVSPSQYQMFYFHVWKKLPARQVAQRLDVKLAEVYYAKYTVSRLLQKEIKRLENQVL